MLGEFNRVFNVDAASDIIDGDADKDGELSRRNSQQYSDAAADQLLGLTGRTLHSLSSPVVYGVPLTLFIYFLSTHGRDSFRRQ